MSLEKQNEIMWNAMSRLMKMKGLTPAASRVIMDATTAVMKLKRGEEVIYSPFRDANETLEVGKLCKVLNIPTHVFTITKAEKLDVDGKSTEIFDIKSCYNLNTNLPDESLVYHNITKNIMKSVVKNNK